MLGVVILYVELENIFLDTINWIFSESTEQCSYYSMQNHDIGDSVINDEQLTTNYS